MDKKLKKYIERYDLIQNCETYELLPNGGMIVLINQETNCEVLIEQLDKFFKVITAYVEHHCEVIAAEVGNIKKV